MFFEEFSVEGNGENDVGEVEIGGESEESGGGGGDPCATWRTVTDANREGVKIGGRRRSD